MTCDPRLETLDDLRAVMSAAQLTRTLQVAHRLGIFAALATDARTLPELAAATSTSAELLEPVLIACRAMGLLGRDGDRFANRPVAEAHLVPGRPLYQGNMISHGMEVWRVWDRLPQRYWPDHGEGAWSQPEDFILAMHNLTAPDAGAALARDVPLAGRRRLADIGGGPGTYSVYLCRANPELRATVWDLPATIAIARHVVEQYPDVADRVSFVAGDWDRDEFGEGYDALLMSNVLHGEPSDPRPKLAKAFRALDPGGLIIVQDFILDDDRAGPLCAALFNLYIGAFTFGELAKLLGESGFVEAATARAPEVAGCGVITARKP